MASTIALFREQRVFVKKETTAGVQIDPVDADEVLVVEPGECNQQIELLEDEQFRNSRSKHPLIRGRTPPGNWSVTTYLKPSGTLGTPPEQDTLLECAFGTQTINAGVDVQYTLADELPSFSGIWLRGHTAFYIRGATVNKMEAMVQGDSPGKTTFSGQFMEMAYAGTDAVGTGGITDVATTLPVVDGSKYYVTSNTTVYIKVSTEVMKVTAVSGNNLTVTRAQKGTTGIAHLAGVVITPWTPTGTESGHIVHGKEGAVTVGGTNYLLITSKVMLENNIKYYDNEKNGVFTAETYGVPSHRMCTVESSRYFRAADVGDWKDALNRTTAALVLPLGSTATKIMEFTAPNATFISPKIGGSEEMVQELTFRLVAAIGSPGTELKLTCK